MAIQQPSSLLANPLTQPVVQRVESKVNPVYEAPLTESLSSKQNSYAVGEYSLDSQGRVHWTQPTYTPVINLLNQAYLDQWVDKQSITMPVYNHDQTLAKPLEKLLDRIRVANGMQAGAKVVISNEDDYQAYASSVNTGVYSLTLGMIHKADSPEELATVLAHEVAHDKQRYSRKTMLGNLLGVVIVLSLTIPFMNSTLDLLMAPAKKLFGKALGPWVPILPLAIVAGIAAGALESLPLRRREREADSQAMQFLANAHLPLSGIQSFTDHLEQAEKETLKGFKGVLYKLMPNHPTPKSRLANFEAAKAQIDALGSRATTPVFAPAEWETLKQTAASYMKKYFPAESSSVQNQAAA